MMYFWDHPRGEKGVRLQKEFDELGWSEKNAKEYLQINGNRLSAMLHGSFDNVPGSIFVLMAAQGVDIQYVLTGKPAKIDPQESALLDNYRNSSPDSQSAIRKIGSALAEQDEELMQRIVTRG